MPADEPAAPVADARPRRSHRALLASTATTLRLWLWAASAGAAAAAATLAFRWLTLQVEWLATRQTSGLVEAARAIPAPRTHR